MDAVLIITASTTGGTHTRTFPGDEKTGTDPTSAVRGLDDTFERRKRREQTRFLHVGMYQLSCDVVIVHLPNRYGYSAINITHT